jgi:DNA-binding Lrp family transcriptional regulator
MTVFEPDHTDKKILWRLQGDLGESSEPFAEIADAVGTTEQDVRTRIKRMSDEGIIRRFGAMIRHIQAGIGFNGMVVWKPSPDRIEEVGLTLAAFPEVTHCYERPPFGKNGGTLFTMAHAASEEECLALIRRMSEAVGVDEFEVLFSERELKKVSPVYYDDED